MRRWLIVTGGVALLLAVILGFVAATARGPYVLAWFRNPDGSPCPRLCFLGIMPGITDFQQAAAILEEGPLGLHSSRPSGNENITTFTNDSIQVTIGSEVNQNTLAWLSLVVLPTGEPDPFYTLADFVAALGRPDRARVESGGIVVDTMFHRDYLMLSTLIAGFTPDTPVRHTDQLFMVYMVSERQYRELLGNISHTLRGWYGFTAIRRYINRPDPVVSP